ncbi:hypothetical protein FMUAM8_50250 [Nocardia cyriacigeorgica]|nr:hypothetical protein FMUAM8_50250 [Nocardia cyriacigeorgica]
MRVGLVAAMVGVPDAAPAAMSDPEVDAVHDVRVAGMLAVSDPAGVVVLAVPDPAAAVVLGAAVSGVLHVAVVAVPDLAVSAPSCVGVAGGPGPAVVAGLDRAVAGVPDRPPHSADPARRVLRRVARPLASPRWTCRTTAHQRPGRPITGRSNLRPSCTTHR